MAVAVVDGPICGAPGCERPVNCRGLCQAHVNRLRKSGIVGGPIRPKVHSYGGAACAVDRCRRPARDLGMCTAHALRQRRYGNPLASQSIRTFGQGFISKDGYRYIVRRGHPNAKANGRILEHRWVMAEFLQRALLADESVHHRNGHRLDNRIENLELWSGLHPAGQRVTDLLAWAQEIVARYGGASSL